MQSEAYASGQEDGDVVDGQAQGQGRAGNHQRRRRPTMKGAVTAVAVSLRRDDSDDAIETSSHEQCEQRSSDSQAQHTNDTCTPWNRNSMRRNTHSGFANHPSRLTSPWVSSRRGQVAHASQATSAINNESGRSVAHRSVRVVAKRRGGKTVFEEVPREEGFVE